MALTISYRKEVRTIETEENERVSKRTKPKPAAGGAKLGKSPHFRLLLVFFLSHFFPSHLSLSFLPSLLLLPSLPIPQEQLHIGSLDQPSSSFSVLIICVCSCFFFLIQKTHTPASRAYLRKAPSRWSSKSTRSTWSTRQEISSRMRLLITSATASPLTRFVLRLSRPFDAAPPLPYTCERWILATSQPCPSLNCACNQLTIESKQIRSLMDRRANIRNMSVIAHGKQLYQPS